MYAISVFTFILWLGFYPALVIYFADIYFFFTALNNFESASAPLDIFTGCGIFRK